MAFVGDHHVEVTGGIFVGAADHGLEQGYRDLLFLARGPGPQPIARVRGKEILDSSERLPGKLVAVHEHEDALRPTGLEEALQLVPRVPTGLPQPVVNRDPRVRFGMTWRHPTTLCRKCIPRGRCSTVMARS